MMTIIKTISLLAVVTASLGCSTITIHPDQLSKLASHPNYERSHDFYFWGLKGDHKIDVSKICGQDNVRQMQTQMSFKDGIFTAITFGIYSPHTIKVWCYDTAKEV